MSYEDDNDIADRLIASDAEAIADFFFNRC